MLWGLALWQAGLSGLAHGPMHDPAAALRISGESTQAATVPVQPEAGGTIRQLPSTTCLSGSESCPPAARGAGSPKDWSLATGRSRPGCQPEWGLSDGVPGPPEAGLASSSGSLLRHLATAALAGATRTQAEWQPECAAAHLPVGSPPAFTAARVAPSVRLRLGHCQ